MDTGEFNAEVLLWTSIQSRGECMSKCFYSFHGYRNRSDGPPSTYADLILHYRAAKWPQLIGEKPFLSPNVHPRVKQKNTYLIFVFISYL